LIADAPPAASALNARPSDPNASFTRSGRPDRMRPRLPSGRLDAMLRFPCSFVDSGLMPARRTAPPTRARSPSEEPTRDALLEALAERERELAEAREQQAAVAQVLQAINASSGDLAAAFDLILEKAVRFCDATGGGLWLVEGDMARVVGSSRSALPRPFLDYVFRAPLPVTDILGRSGRGRPFVHIDDLRATRAYQERAPYVVACVELGDMRTALLAPLFEDGA